MAINNIKLIKEILYNFINYNINCQYLNIIMNIISYYQNYNLSFLNYLKDVPDNILFNDQIEIH